VSKGFFNSRAATWDEKVAEKDVSKLKAMLARLDIKTGATVLDVGTGTGVFVPLLLKKIGREGNLVCLDFAEEMLKITQAKGFKGNISYLCADIENSRLADKSFDAIVCYSVFPHFRDKPKALIKINRLLKKDGKIFICHTSSRQAINEIHRSVPEVCNHLFPENEDTRRMLSEAGFEDIRISDGKEDYLVSARKSK
jgi:demethylmenaquinone methyltransferase/2-methoxy-6-polyprenyl-1,4-benzoquinol methylase